MRDPRHERSRPLAGAAISKNVQAGGPNTSMVPRDMPWDEVAAHIDGTFVVVVKVKGGRYRRRCYLTVKSAEVAVRKAQERGENAVVILAELRPLYRVTGGAR